MTSALSSLYKNKKLVLWVEDPLTRAWLHHLWQDTDLALLVAGGNDAVFAAVRDARASGHGSVFGFRDRDFIASNQGRWLDPGSRLEVFVPDALEVENFLLDFTGLANLAPAHNPRARTADDLEARARAHATQSVWWMAARATIADARAAVTHQFPEHPRLGNPPILTSQQATQADLEGRLLRSSWGQQLQRWVPSLNAPWIAASLTTHHAALTAALGNGRWRWSWSGKELFGPVAGHMGISVVDLAQGLADHQRRTGTIDPAMTALRIALRARAGLDAWPPPPTPPPPTPPTPPPRPTRGARVPP